MQKPKDVSLFEAIGTHWWIESLDGSPISPKDLRYLQDVADQFDDDYSRFKADSLIGRLNATGRLDNPPDELIDMLRFCQEMYEASEGAFNVTVGGVLHSLGYGKRELAAPIYGSPWGHIAISPERITIPRDMTIDTGGYGKGWLIDRLAGELRHLGYHRFLINGGGDIYVESDKEIELALEHPYDAAQIVGTTRIRQGGLAVSGSAKRTWQHEGKKYHHLIDPATSLPAHSSVAGTYVNAPTALLADTMATILFLRPELKDRLSARYGLRAVIIYDDQLS